MYDVYIILIQFNLQNQINDFLYNFYNLLKILRE